MIENRADCQLDHKRSFVHQTGTPVVEYFKTEQAHQLMRQEKHGGTELDSCCILYVISDDLVSNCGRIIRHLDLFYAYLYRSQLLVTADQKLLVTSYPARL